MDKNLYLNEEIKKEDYENVRKAAIEGVGLKEEDGDMTCLRLNPKTDLVIVSAIKVGSTKKPTKMIPEEDGTVGLDTLENNQEYDITIFSKDTDPPLILHSFRLKKNGDGTISIQAIDTTGTVIEASFKSKDSPVGGAKVLGTFTSSKGQNCNLKGTTDSKGRFKIVLPQGVISKLQANKGELTVSKRGTILVPPPGDPSIPRKTKIIAIELDPSSFGSAIQPNGMYVVVLGDISGSMASGNKMDILKRSFIDCFEKAKKEKWNLALATWDSWVDWCLNSKWIDLNQEPEVKRWINRKLPQGGNDMRYAIEEAMRKFPEATDIYIMCDGDISPFNATSGDTKNILTDVPKPGSPGEESRSKYYNNSSWTEFRKRFPNTNFSFIALGSSSSASDMQKMALIGNGDFWESN